MDRQYWTATCCPRSDQCSAASWKKAYCVSLHSVQHCRYLVKKHLMTSGLHNIPDEEAEVIATEETKYNEAVETVQARADYRQQCDIAQSAAIKFEVVERAKKKEAERAAEDKRKEDLQAAENKRKDAVQAAENERKEAEQAAENERKWKAMRAANAEQAAEDAAEKRREECRQAAEKRKKEIAERQKKEAERQEKQKVSVSDETIPQRIARERFCREENDETEEPQPKRPRLTPQALSVLSDTLSRAVHAGRNIANHCQRVADQLRAESKEMEQARESVDELNRSMGASTS